MNTDIEQIKTKSAQQLANMTAYAINNTNDKYVQYRTSRPVISLKQMFESSVDLYGDNPAFRQKFNRNEPYKIITYKEALEDRNALGTSLIDAGLKGKRIGIIGENCYRWAISYLAVTGGVGTVVPLDKDLNDLELAQLVENSEISAIIFASKFKDKLLRIKKEEKNCLKILIDMSMDSCTEDIYSLSEMIEKGKSLIEDGCREYLDAFIDPEAMSILLFTSGTTGIAKGVMLSQRNICQNLMCAPTIVNVDSSDIFFSVLPIHHTYECTGGFLMPLYKGASIAYCEGLKHIQKNLKEVRPTIFLAVPLILESLYKAIWKNIKKKGKEGTIRKIMALSDMLGKPGHLIQKKVFNDISAVFGGRIKVLISGGAAIDPATLKFYNNLGFTAIQGYGLTECSPLVALNPDKYGMYRNDSAGHLLPGMDVKIHNPNSEGIGEICLKGPNVMMGYYKMPEETAEVLKNGWFHTGDLGYVDDDNFIYITGRAKNVIITANGKNVFPEELENYLSKIELISESMVWAEKDADGNDSVITATIYPNWEHFKEGASVQKILENAVCELNKTLPVFKQIKKIIVKPEDFEKTTANKIKRFVEANKR